MKYNQSYTARHEYHYFHSGDSRKFWHAAFYSNLLFTTTPVSVGINSGLKLTGLLPGISLGE